MEASFNHFPQIARNLCIDCAQVAKETAEACLVGYQSRARENTGAQKASAYLVTSSSSTYSAAVEAASSLNEKATMLPEIDHPTSETEAIAAVAAGYAVINELGGVHHTADGAMAQTGDAEYGPFLSRLSAVRWRP